ncbi:hypothetical protein [Bdellovibrio sp. HCB-162]|uniref:hypothetical protein n=1 Tax=Bdellovibrio sp. HCB-162 TaxID=3394234 RepID=UPI0039BD0AFF
MPHFRILLGFLIACSFLSTATFAFSRRKPVVIDYPQTTYVQGNTTSSFTPSSSEPSTDMLKLAQSASEGAGRLKEKGALCYRAVKQIIADAFGKDLACVRGILSSGSAKDAGGDLLKMGFIQDMSSCNKAGAVRVYKGVGAPGYRKLPGDIHGHIEVVGDEGMYHSFYSSSMSMDDSMPGRRILTGCYVPHYDKIRSAPLSQCPNSSVSYKTHRPPSSRSKSGSQ